MIKRIKALKKEIDTMYTANADILEIRAKEAELRALVDKMLEQKKLKK